MANVVRQALAIATANATSVSKAFAACANPSLLVASVTSERHNDTFTITDTASHGWSGTPDKLVSNALTGIQTGGGTSALFSVQNTGTGTPTVTSTPGGGSVGCTIMIYEVTGCDTSSAIDSTASSVSAASGTINGSLTTVAANCTVIGAFVGYSSPTTNVDTGFTGNNGGMTAIVNSYHGGEYIADIGAAGGYTLSYNSFAPIVGHSAVWAAYKPASGGGTTVALTGVSGTGAVGTLAPGASLAITGNTGTGTVGSLAPSVSIALTGVAGIGAVGTLTPVSGVVIALTGVSASGDIGLLAPSVSAVLTGVQAIGAVGSLSIPGSNVYGRSGLGGDDVPRRKNPNRGWDREEWLARKQKMDDMEQTLRETYQSIKRTALPSVIKEVEKVVSKNVVKIKNENGIVERSIDFRTLALNYERTNSLIQLLDDDDEEEIILIAAQHLAFMTLQ